MDFTLRITQQAEDELDQLIQFIEQQWPTSVKTDLLASMAHKMQLIETMPFVYRASVSEPSIRECTINTSRCITGYLKLRLPLMYYPLETIAVVHSKSLHV